MSDEGNSTTETKGAGETSADTSTAAGSATETDKIDPSLETNTVDYWKQRSRQNEKVAKDNAEAAKAAKELKAEFDAFKAKAEGKEAEYAAAQETQRVKDEALSAANQRILKAELRTAAKGKLTDPTDIFRFPEIVDLSAFEVGADGEVDAAALEAAVTNLITKRPDLAAQGGRFQGSADGGARNGSTASIDDRIAEATTAGNHQLAIALKQRRAAEIAAKKS